MTNLVRKISRAKWKNAVDGGEIGADAITSCLRTSKNTLSTWRISEEKELPEAVLAIVSGLERIDTIDVVWLDRSSLEKYGLGCENTPESGITPIDELKDRHIDITNLTYNSLGIVANEVVCGIRDNRYKRVSAKDIKKMLKAAIDIGRLQEERLKDGVRKELQS